MKPIRSWSPDRLEIEQFAIVSSWSSERTARALLEFPDSAWMRTGHKLAVQAIRSLLVERQEVNDLAVGIRMREIDKQHGSAAWKELQVVYHEHLVGISALHAFALQRMRHEYQWQLAGNLVEDAAGGLREGAFGDWFGRMHKQFLALASTETDREVRPFNEVVLERIERRLSGDLETPPSTGIPELDDYIHGLGRKQVVLLVGPPGMGKTTLGFQLSVNLSRAGDEVYFNELEMNEEEMADRAICAAVKKELKEVLPEDLERARKATGLLSRVYLSDEHCSLQECDRKTRAHLYRRPQTKVVVTDYAGLLQKHDTKTKSVDAANEVSAWAKKLASDHGICHILLQQPTKQYQRDRRPMVEHIRDSGKFEQDAHVILFLHYPRQWDESMPEDYIQLHILKNRSGRREGIVHLHWQPGFYTVRQWKWAIPASTGGTDRGRLLQTSLSELEFEDIPL